jgi:hypothetical protein
MGLPQHIEKVCLRHSPDKAQGRLYALVTHHAEEESFDAEVVDESGTKYVQLTGYRTVALPYSVDTELLKALQAVAA